MKALIYFLFLCCCTISVLASEAKISQLTLKTFNNETIIIKDYSPRILFFFDAKEKETEECLKIVNQLFVAYKKYNVQVISIYSDLEPLDKQQLQKLQTSFPNLTLCIDEERTEIKKLYQKFDTQIPIIIPFILVINSNNEIVYKRSQLPLEYRTLWTKTKIALGYFPKDKMLSPMLSYNWTSETQKEPKISTQNPTTVSKEETNSNIKENSDIIFEDSEEELDIIAENPIIEKEQDIIADNPIIEKEQDIIADNPIIEENTSSQDLPQYTENDKIHNPETIEHNITTSVINNTPQNLSTKKENEPLFSDSKTKTIKEEVMTSWFSLCIKYIIPLCICFWGMIFALRQCKKYYGMIGTFFACFIFFVWILCNLYIKIPNIVLSYPILTQIQMTLTKILTKPLCVSIQQIIFIVCQFLLVNSLVYYWRKECTKKYQ